MSLGISDSCATHVPGGFASLWPMWRAALRALCALRHWLGHVARSVHASTSFAADMQACFCMAPAGQACPAPLRRVPLHTRVPSPYRTVIRSDSLLNQTFVFLSICVTHVTGVPCAIAVSRNSQAMGFAKVVQAGGVERASIPHHRDRNSLHVRQQVAHQSAYLHELTLALCHPDAHTFAEYLSCKLHCADI